jgi:putative transposase
MARRVRPRAVALWRYEQIAPLLDPELSKQARAALVDRLSKIEVPWPSGALRPISRVVLYRWARAYRRGGFRALAPKGRSDIGTLRAAAPETIERAIALLEEEPRRSLYWLRKVLEVPIGRSTLHRHIRAHPRYAAVRARAKEKGRARSRRDGLHRRFEAKAPHVIWQTDAKGPFPVRIAGVLRQVHVVSIIDDHSRAVLAAIVAPSPNLAAAVRVFRLAAARWGLPVKLYADRASIFDSVAFRTGLGVLGVHRIETRPGNAAAHGKVEAYHRSLERWFVVEVRHQVVQSLEHLEQLLIATLELLYHDHVHDSLKMTPREALAGRISTRRVPLERLEAAFFVEKEVKAHPKTGELRVEGRPFRVPRKELAGRRVRIVYDPVAPERPFVEDDASGRRELLRPLFDEPLPKPRSEERGPGQLQRLLDRYRGRTLPQAEAGCGLPELYELLGATIGRRVPADGAEAELVQRFLRRVGPFARAPLEAALALIRRRLGAGRPLSTYLSALERRIPHDPNPENEESIP